MRPTAAMSHITAFVKATLSGGLGLDMPAGANSLELSRANGAHETALAVAIQLLVRIPREFHCQVETCLLAMLLPTPANFSHFLCILGMARISDCDDDEGAYACNKHCF